MASTSSGEYSYHTPESSQNNLKTRHQDEMLNEDERECLQPLLLGFTSWKAYL